MRKLTIMFLLIAGASLGQIWGPGGVPVDWSGLGIEVMEADTFQVLEKLIGDTAFVSVDSLHADHWTGANAVLSGPLSADSIEADHVTGADANFSGAVSAGTVIVDDYTRYQWTEAGNANLGPTPPSWAENATVGGLAFDADAEVVHLRYCVPADWNGSSDMTLYIHWTPERGDAVADTETVIWKIQYRSIVWGTEVADNGTAVDGSVTYTQSGAGTDGATFVSQITIDYDNVNQPLTVGDCIVMTFNRDVGTDTYSGDGIVLAWRLAYTGTGLI